MRKKEKEFNLFSKLYKTIYKLSLTSVKL